MRRLCLYHIIRWAVSSVALIFGAACILSGCGPPGDGTDARAVGRYVSQEYGKAKLIQVSSRTSSWAVLMPLCGWRSKLTGRWRKRRP